MYSLLTMADVQQAAITLLSGSHPPTAVITNSDYTALAIYKAARELSLPIGHGVSVVGHDDLPTSELLAPPLATIRMDQRAMGRALMMRLLEPGLQEDYVAPSSWSGVPRSSGRITRGHALLTWPDEHQVAVGVISVTSLDTREPATPAYRCKTF